MQYYEYHTDANYFFAFELPDDLNSLSDVHFKKRRVLTKWTPVSLTGYDDNPGILGDFPTLADLRSFPLFSPRAWESLQPLIGKYCEPLPVTLLPDRDPFFLIHIIPETDCLDRKRAQVELSRVDGRVSRVRKYAFKAELMESLHLFRLPIESGGDVIVSDTFRECCKQNNLVGLTFKPLPMATDKY